jgi:rhamnopyranosyl-N-acetylglucosaminyl-diphospho-decaprenol beta-1,3/1,4-galactofuranosyltransferase
VSQSEASIAGVVLARDRVTVTRQTIDALLAQEPAVDALLLIDNAGPREMSELLARAAASHRSGRVLRLERNLGCAGGFEAGLRSVLEREDVDYVCCFDDDAVPHPGCVAALREAALSLPAVGCVGALSHDARGTLAWWLPVIGEPETLRNVGDVHALASGRLGIPVTNMPWHGLMIPTSVLRRHGSVWGELYFQYEDVELGLRYRRAGLNNYLVPAAECTHHATVPDRELSILGRTIYLTRQSPAKEYLTLRNGLRVARRHDGLRFWYASGPALVLRAMLTSLQIDWPRRRALRHVFLRGIVDAARGRLGPPPPELGEL